jgi:hypothetical protein
MNWHTFAGGTTAAEGKNSYVAKVPGFGEYHIQPVCWPNSSRHRGYCILFANMGGIVPVSGLWWAIGAGGLTVSFQLTPLPNLKEAKRRCEQHYNRYKERV